MTNNSEDEAMLTRYYMNQAGSGIEVYRGVGYQKGYGVGSFLGGLFRSVLPLLRKGGKVLGNELLNTAFNVLGDVKNNGKSFESSLKDRGSETISNLKRRALDSMNGGGLKRMYKSKTRQCRTKSRQSQSLTRKSAGKKKNKSKKSQLKGKVQKKRVSKKIQSKQKAEKQSLYNYF